MSLDRRLASSQALPDPLLNLFLFGKGSGRAWLEANWTICSVNET